MFTHSATVVYESCQVSTLGGIYNCVVVHSKQIAAPDALLCVPLLTIVSHHLDTQQKHFPTDPSKRYLKRCVTFYLPSYLFYINGGACRCIIHNFTIFVLQICLKITTG